MEQDLFWVLLSAHCEGGDFSLIRLHKVEGEMRLRDEEGEKREGELTHIYCNVSPPLRLSLTSLFYPGSIFSSSRSRSGLI